MNEIRKKSIGEQVGGRGKPMKGKVKEGLGKVTGNRDLESEGWGEGKARQKIDKAGRAVGDAAERIKDRLRGYDE
jgi:uncharacterized protein YjbJ (UPF0337 family)